MTIKCWGSAGGRGERISKDSPTVNKVPAEEDPPSTTGRPGSLEQRHNTKTGLGSDTKSDVYIIELMAIFLGTSTKKKQRIKTCG